MDRWLYYHRARWYDPHAGRWISEDPIGLAGGMSLYGYASNDPISNTDPTGLCTKTSYRKEAGFIVCGVPEDTCPGGQAKDKNGDCQLPREGDRTPPRDPSRGDPGNEGTPRGNYPGVSPQNPQSTPTKDPPRKCETPSARELLGINMAEAIVPAAIEAFHSMRQIRAGAQAGGVFLGNGAVSVFGEGALVLTRATVVGLLGAEIYNLGKINYELVQVWF